MPYIIVENSEEWIENRWDWGGFEIIPFDVENPQVFDTTCQYWQIYRKFIKFNVRVEIDRSDDEITKIRITYCRADNRDLFDSFDLEASDIIWGIHTLVIVDGEKSGRSVWQPEGKPESAGPGWRCSSESIFGGPTNRWRSTIWAIQRGHQGELRQQLCAIDGKCALTGETCEVALEAAHIVPAHRGGREVVFNAILLRSDIHRLYDATPPRFRISPETGEVSANDFLYESFDFQGRQISQEILERIREALLWRQNNGL